MTVKTGIDGKPFDPAKRARESMEFLRNNVMNAITCPARIEQSLAFIADRLQTCDALEMAIQRLKEAHVELIQAAALLAHEHWVALAKKDDLFSRLRNALGEVRRENEG